jgi:hypothetical protein
VHIQSTDAVQTRRKYVHRDYTDSDRWRPTNIVENWQPTGMSPAKPFNIRIRYQEVSRASNYIDIVRVCWSIAVLNYVFTSCSILIVSSGISQLSVSLEYPPSAGSESAQLPQLRATLLRQGCRRSVPLPLHHGASAMVPSWTDLCTASTTTSQIGP